MISVPNGNKMLTMVLEYNKIGNVKAYIKNGEQDIWKGIREKEMELLNKALAKKKERPVKVLQFGEGNFLRGFADYMIDIANEKGFFDGDIVLVKPMEGGSLDKLRQQECQYTVLLKGMEGGKVSVQNRTITSVTDAVAVYEEYERYSEYAKLETLRFIVSNTTEAGIVYDGSDRPERMPPHSFPGKLTKFLYERYRYFHGAADKGLIILPVELIDDNGIMLKECVTKLAVLWQLEDGFRAWLEEACIFCSTLVDRIISGYPKDEEKELWEQLGYEDHLMVAGEPFALWVIESAKDISGEFPLREAGLPVIFTDCLKPYKQRKVRILNGAHTSFAPASYLAGNDYVLQSMEDRLIYDFMHDTVYDEIIPTLSLPEKELRDFADAAVGRFRNPYVQHALLSIALNSVSKWRARCLPSFLGYVEKTGKLPGHLTFSLAALMAFYTGSEYSGKALIGKRGDGKYEIRDEEAVLRFFSENSRKDTEEFVRLFLSHKEFFGQDFTRMEGLTGQVTAYLAEIRKLGMRGAMEKFFPAEGQEKIWQR